MLTIAKPLANGLPIGAILVNDAVARAMQPGDHGTTFGGGPLLAHVAHHVVQRLSDPAMLQHVRETGAWFGEQLQGIADRTGQVRAIRGKGLMWGMDVHEPAAAIIGRAFEKLLQQNMMQSGKRAHSRCARKYRTDSIADTENCADGYHSPAALLWFANMHQLAESKAPLEVRGQRSPLQID
jgi:acetylornithine/succinyldiaminopimelate/putrescine aminotransferase